MQTLARLTCLGLLVLAAGCVPSLHPLYTDMDYRKTWQKKRNQPDADAVQ